jgi:hypothetical protein
MTARKISLRRHLCSAGRIFGVLSAAVLVAGFAACGHVAARSAADDVIADDVIAASVPPAEAGTVHRLVNGSVPGGPAFAIVGVSKHARGKTDFAVTVQVAQPGPRPGSTGGPSSTLSTTSAERRSLRLQLFTGCAGAKAYVIAYGVLRAKRARVLLRAPGRTVALRDLALPDELDHGAEFVYVAIPWVPTNVVVRSGRRSVTTQRYGALADERCPGGQGSTTGTIG